MKRKENFLPAFLVVFFLCILIFGLSLSGNLNFLSSFLEKGTATIQSSTFKIWQKLPFVTENPRIKKLEEENLELLSQIATFEKLKKENAALSDQFQTAYPQAVQLLKAEIIGTASFIPGISAPNVLIVNRGSKDNLKVGMAVIVKDNLVGIISKVSENLSEINTVNSPLVSFTAKTESGVAGIIKKEEGLTLDNILLSENLIEGGLILTKGNIDNDGIGIPPDLIVGKIISVEKKPSDLFQKAKLESFVNFMSLSTVFIYTQIK